jgi:hypothetical protein
VAEGEIVNRYVGEMSVGIHRCIECALKLGGRGDGGGTIVAEMLDVGFVQSLERCDAAGVARLKLFQRHQVLLQARAAHGRQARGNKKIKFITSGCQPVEDGLGLRIGRHSVAQPRDAEIFEVVDHHGEVVVTVPGKSDVRIDSDGINECGCGTDCLVRCRGCHQLIPGVGGDEALRSNFYRRI